LRFYRSATGCCSGCSGPRLRGRGCTACAVARKLHSGKQSYTKGKGEDRKEEVSFIDCTAFSKTAETAAEYLKKGRSVHVEGRLQQERWESQDGKKMSKVKVIVERLTFVGGKGEAPAAAPADEEFQG